MKIDPVRGAATLGAAEGLALEAARFGDVPDLDRDMKWREHHEGTAAPDPALPVSIVGRACGTTRGACRAQGVFKVRM